MGYVRHWQALRERGRRRTRTALLMVGSVRGRLSRPGAPIGCAIGAQPIGAFFCAVHRCISQDNPALRAYRSRGSGVLRAGRSRPDRGPAAPSTRAKLGRRRRPRRRPRRHRRRARAGARHGRARHAPGGTRRDATREHRGRCVAPRGRPGARRRRAVASLRSVRLLAITNDGMTACAGRCASVRGAKLVVVAL